MKKLLLVPLVLLMVSIPPAFCQDDNGTDYFSPEQIDNLVAPIALYPDPLLAQVLLAATFPDQIDEAARFVRANSDPNYIDEEPWDVSVKAVAHYPTVLFNMADKLDWTTALGQAYVNQSTDVMASVQRLRVEARSAGSLVTTPQQQVVEEGGYVQIYPAQPQYIYVPVYDPALVYVRRPGFFVGLSFGRAFFIGAWLNHDFDWHEHRVYYHGWDDHDRIPWVVRSRPFVRVTNVYVNTSYRNVVINRTVINRTVNYNTLDRYHSVHRDVHYDNFRGRSQQQVVIRNDRPRVENKIIDRNINVRDSRIDSYRGHQPDNRPDFNRQQDNRPVFNQQNAPRPQVNQPPANRPQFNQQPMNRPQVENQRDNAFGGNRGGFDPRQASQRGHESRTQTVVNRPAPASKPAPAARRESGDDRGRNRR